MTDGEHNQWRRQASAALLLHTPEAPTGKRPTPDELWDWIHNELSAERAAEVKNHVASDDELYEEWRQLRLAIEDTESDLVNPGTDDSPAQTSDSRLSILGRFSEYLANLTRPTIPVLATGTAAVVVLAISVTHLRTPDSINFWQDWQQPKGQTNNARVSGALPAYEAILTGMAQQLKANSIPANSPFGTPLPGTASECLKESSCLPHISALNHFGQQLATTRLACIATYATTQSIEQLPVPAEELTYLPTLAELHFPIRQWRSSTDKIAMCTHAELLIARVLATID